LRFNEQTNTKKIFIIEYDDTETKTTNTYQLTSINEPFNKGVPNTVSLEFLLAEDFESNNFTEGIPK
jgi:hypothetical protein